MRWRGGYRSRLQLQVLDDLRVIVVSTSLAATAVISVRVVVADDSWVAAETIRLWLFSTAYLAAGRAGLFWAQRRARRLGEAGRPTLIVGAGRIGQLTATRLVEHPELGLRPVGFLDKEPLGDAAEVAGLPVLGASWDLERIAASHGVEHVIIAFSTAPHEVLLGLVRRCDELGIAVSQVPRLFERVTDRVAVEHLGGLPLLSVEHADPKGWQFTVKYGLDRIVAAFLLLLTSPVLGASALAIWITMGRPLFHRQPRVGRDGRIFEMLKFRSMSGSPEASGEADLDWAQAQLGAGSSADGENTPDRRTPVGRFLRRFSLDELPQLWNVFRGDMSLVGPRPERVDYVREFERAVYRYGERHRVKSGITGWAQVNGLRGKTSLADRVEWDNYYIENWSLWLDFKILLLTVLAVFRSGETA
jgi:exopolysaccharide biosynthesis polyprenyl glycosylphosphotransferase